ncbi:hypothetical protein Goshw_012342 [Gossypium schwendimanii]|uniref:RNase H type-1 domain-containing protein n=1 Tax=Gossypium schwendimanii TaxID=34291 RepID=A0A7J9M334_GOSSC|nr:hypothetical protein [Gossypium schwendimanii]
MSTLIKGVIREGDVIWVCGFSMAVGKEMPFKIEARSILEGHHLAWEKRLKQVELECDNALLASIFVGSNWKIRVRHVPIAHNEVAYHMTKCVNSCFMSLTVFDEPPVSIQELLLADCNSSSRV